MISKSIKSNFISGFLVFLIALPLCLGIAKASGFPPIAGIYTAIIGGLIVTFLSKAPLAIKGPAAGLIAIAINAVEELGGDDPILGYQLTLAVIVVSGVLQILMGFAKFGKMGDMFPISVIRGMLAAIGVIIISKQIHVIMGVVPEAKSPWGLLAEIPHSILHLNPKVAVIGVLSLALLFGHPHIKNATIKKLPAPLLILLVAIPLGFVFNLSNEHSYSVGSFDYDINPTQFLVVLPDSFLSGITFPDFSQLLTYTSFKYVLMFALVGSIESVLSAKAVDALDPKGRVTNLNQDLVAVGIGNTIAGLIGGLPMISEIVRSSANINAGAKGRMSNFYHGLFLFLFVLLAAAVIKTIPNAALAAMLVFTGLKLASPKEFKKINSIGLDQLLQFLTTLIVTLLTDLLVGVAAGIALKVAIELVQGVKLKEMFDLKTQVSASEDGLVIKFTGIASFINYLKFKTLIDAQPKNQKIVLDFSESYFIDHTFLNNIHNIQNKFTKEGGELIKVGFENHHFQSQHHLASRRLVTNPYHQATPQYELSKRAGTIQNMALRHELDFEANLSPSFVRPYLSAFSILSRLRRAKNFILGTREHYSFMICDITYVNVSDFSTENRTATIALIFNIAKGGIPDFYTKEKGELFDLVRQYDFDFMPKSNGMPFNVFGNNKQLVDSFFTPEVTHIIAENPYSIECKRREMLVHKEWEVIPEGDALEEMLSYVDQLASEVVKKRLEEAQKVK
ncbi:SulP family inorganic anion transporter [Flammeovirga sp. EKP202]|uniref:SulP family inorganic anion transporter n=1 Tax=Flammeovirga sp. EKP202 TaxID=2770592 RepID=UPI00165FCFB9|nr:SulP family inorganic anion transporter [Flammeovirga sp. EKP202]MBD0404340.1 SulP family inorganic anion transporter [Flammeovirga sp. EKP202]